MQQQFRLPFLPGQELEADRDSITWAYGAGYDPRAVERVYEVLEAAGLTAPALLPAFIGSHPLSGERRANLGTTYGRLQMVEPNDRLYVGRENLLRRIPRSSHEFAE